MGRLQQSQHRLTCGYDAREQPTLATTAKTGTVGPSSASTTVIHLTPLRVGLIAAQANEAETTADFDYFTIGALPLGSPYADRVVNYVPGSGCWGGEDPNAALGQPDGDIHAQPLPTGLVCLGAGGLVTLEFVDNTVIDQPGPDLVVLGDPEQDDQILVEVSSDGDTWHAFPVSGENSPALDLAALGLPFARFVRIADVQPGTVSGAEVDAIEALHSGPPR
jgi:hypothetical protein